MSLSRMSLGYAVWLTVAFECMPLISMTLGKLIDRAKYEISASHAEVAEFLVSFTTVFQKRDPKSS